ncbi:MAG: (2Fe-2S)-binding protein [Myxococcaceae bacterium]|nr:(2Fe-2S)-binding protein [Myxococcaceae bacterium]
MSEENKPAAAAPAPPAPARPTAPPPKNPGFVTFSVDGKEVIAKPGTNMIDAVKTVGTDIPYYCYHPRLSVAANCRMCMVEVNNGAKLVPACQTAIAEGQKVVTNSVKVKEQQRAVMEFLLLNHPVDCSICDQAGECKLQDYYMRYDHKPSRLTGSKVLRNKRKVLGPLVVLDQERCVLCTRCVRFMDEVAKEPQLGVFGRGSHERIDVFPGMGAALTSNYSGNTVDICPVGALLNREFRFRARAWFLSAAPSVCTGCSRGCSTYADFMGQETYRYRPRENDAINKSWLCDQGRLTYKELNQNRALNVVLGRGQDAREATRAEAVKYAALKLKAHVNNVHVLVSAVASNEDVLASMTFVRDTLGMKTVYLSGRPQGDADHFLMQADKNPNRRGLTDIAAALGIAVKPFAELTQALDANHVKALYAIGTQVPEDATVFSNRLANVDVFIAQTVHENPIARLSHALLPASTHVEDEGTFTQEAGITQRFRRAYPPKGESSPHWKWAAEISTEMGTAMAFSNSREVFKTLASNVPSLANYAWDKEAPMNQRRTPLSPLAASADGRPPGYREGGVPRVRGI